MRPSRSGEMIEVPLGPPAVAAAATPEALPPELAFLPATLVPHPVLARAAAEANRLRCSPERVVLAEGLVTADSYYRLLAAHLGLPFAERPLRPAPGATWDAVLRHGVLPLVPNPHGWVALAAPSGAFLSRLLARGPHPDAPATLALTSPDRLEALFRQGRRAVVLREASHGLPDWNGALSAYGGLSHRQRLWAFAILVVFAFAAVEAAGVCLSILALLFSAGFLLALGVRLAATAAVTTKPAPRPPAISEAALPVYTVVVPLFREAREVHRLVAALDRLDYPAAKLDIMLMIEANDRTTLAALDHLRLPSRYRTVVAPRGRPQTKPRALNVALQFARGTFLVVYDAEDEPAPDQLRAAVAAFAAAPGTACLQARLAIDNATDSWLTRIFAIEYAALFGAVNPGLSVLRWPVPLGGTSNHFRTDVLRRLNGWDAWNVTEDIDLGIRLARFGEHVGALDSLTFEEAPRTLKAWLAQRRRWLKGWIVTLVTHSRAPGRTWRELGARPGLALWGLLFGTVASCLLGPFCGAFVVLRLWSGDLLHPQTAAAVGWSALSGLLLLAGSVGVLWPALLGLRRLKQLRLALWLPTVPLYFVLLSVAAWLALFEAIGRPYAWAKTEHGRAKRRIGFALRRS